MREGLGRFTRIINKKYKEYPHKMAECLKYSVDREKLKTVTNLKDCATRNYVHFVHIDAIPKNT